MEDLDEAVSGGIRVISGSGDVLPKSQSLMVRSNDPDTIQFCSRLSIFVRVDTGKHRKVGRDGPSS